MNTHYGLLVFLGDFDGDHPDEARRGCAPSLEFLAAGPEQFCWDSVGKYVLERGLQRDELVEVVTRDPLLVAQQTVAAEHALEYWQRRREEGGEG